MKDKVEKVLDEVRPGLQADGGDVELVDVSEDGIVKVRLTGACAGCPMSTLTLKMAIEKKLKEQLVDNYYDVLVGENTERYVPRIVAAKEILSHPKKYGFEFDKNDLYVIKPFYVVKVDTVITDIAVFAQKFGTNYKELKLHNPWLRENKLNNKSRKMYEIKIPVK